MQPFHILDLYSAEIKQYVRFSGRNHHAPLPPVQKENNCNKIKSNLVLRTDTDTPQKCKTVNTHSIQSECRTNSQTIKNCMPCTDWLIMIASFTNFSYSIKGARFWDVLRPSQLVTHRESKTIPLRPRFHEA